MWGGLKDLPKQILRTLRRDSKEDIIELLSREYADKVKDARQFRLHAEQMRYDHFRLQLQRIAAEEDQHAQWLKERIVALGVPSRESLSDRKMPGILGRICD